MLTTQQKEFIELLEKMFQFDQADLDFGIYRIMNQKRDEIRRFLHEELIPQVKKAFEKYRNADVETIKQQLTELEQKLSEMGVAKESSEKYRTLKEKLNQGVDITALENEVFSDLTNFFRRYYHNGDFLSLRRYKKDVYAIPYEGEEVKLHWANADQYYVKTSEYFRDYTFTLPSGKKVHFKLVEASTERDNNKAQKERRFILFDEEPVVEENGELYIRFEYRPIEGKQSQKKINEETLEKLSAIDGFDAWKKELLAPTEKNKNKTLLEKHLNDYTARNTFDYFIHKDLGGFLRRELDFFIKNEIMYLDDIDTENEKKFEQYLSKVKVIKSIGHKIIAFLEQIENFQKKLWLKKKFVVETNYCVTLDRVPEELYPEIIENKEQIEEWKRLFDIDEIKGDLTSVGYCEPLTVEFLKEHCYLTIDTKYFDEQFKYKILSSFHNIDEELNGILIHSENFQALNLIKETYKEKVKSIYIDPPYNTGDDGFVYKDNYKSSSWLTMINQLMPFTKETLDNTGSLFVSCDENEVTHLGLLLEACFGKENHIETIIWNKRVPKNDKGIGNIHEYIFLFTKNNEYRKNHNLSFIMRKDGLDEVYELVEKCKKSGLSLEETQKKLKQFYRKQGFDRGITLYCELDPNYEIWGKINMSWPNPKTEGPRYVVINPVTNKPVPIPKNGWRWTEETFRLAEKDGPTYKLPDGSMMKGRIWYPADEKTQPSSITYLKEVESFLLRSFISLKSDGSLVLENMGLGGLIDYPKPPKLVEHLFYSTVESDGYFLDFFAGSGTSGHAVINLNREDGKNRKYILIEMGDYFDTVLKPRIKKVIYSKDWKDGKPVSRKGSSHIFKYIKLESYEDALNNIQLKRSPQQQIAMDEMMSPEAKEEYMLSYMLDIEAKGSASLLNIDAFSNPFDYKMVITQGTESRITKVDLVETFNYLIGLHVKTIDVIKGIKVITGTLRTGENVLVIWRNTNEVSNEQLEDFFIKQGFNTRDSEFDRIYVNGDNHLENLKLDENKWKVVLIEEEFQRLMFDVRDV